MDDDVLVNDLTTLDIERLDIEFVTETQIVEFISRNKLDLGRLVSEILVANGYQTHASPFGNDGSVEILADRRSGPLGFELPRIAVLVRPDINPASLDLTELEAFIALSGASNGLFVSWTGFTESAQKEAGRLFHQAKFWDVTDVIGMLKANYDKLSDNLRSDLRLQQIWALAGQSKALGKLRDEKLI